MNIVSSEKIIEGLNVELYPITIVKFLLNRRKILSYFSKAAEENFEIRGTKYTTNWQDCKACQERKDSGIRCRQHTSIERVLNAKKVAKDLDTNTFFYKNEIFRMVGNKLVIVYCPHTKLIEGEITDEKVRKVSPITIDDPNLTTLPKYENVSTFLSNEHMNQQIKCWFNKQFSLITIPEDRSKSNWCLLPNQNQIKEEV